MSDKLLVIIATENKPKALTALMYAGAAIRNEWLEDVKVIYFGPIEQLMTTDEEIANAAIELAAKSETYACKAIGDREGISEKMDEMGIKVEYVGSIISDFIKQGYTPMVW